MHVCINYIKLDLLSIEIYLSFLLSSYGKRYTGVKHHRVAVMGGEVCLLFASHLPQEKEILDAVVVFLLFSYSCFAYLHNMELSLYIPPPPPFFFS